MQQPRRASELRLFMQAFDTLATKAAARLRPPCETPAGPTCGAHTGWRCGAASTDQSQIPAVGRAGARPSNCNLYAVRPNTQEAVRGLHRLQPQAAGPMLRLSRGSQHYTHRAQLAPLRLFEVICHQLIYRRQRLHRRVGLAGGRHVRTVAGSRCRSGSQLSRQQALHRHARCLESAAAQQQHPATAAPY